MENPRSLKKPEEKSGGVKRKGHGMAKLITEMLHGATKTHMTHLKTTSYAAHIALNEFYNALPDLADGLAESWQGVTESLLDYPEASVRQISTPKEAISYLKEMYDMVQGVQDHCKYSEIINDLDLVKTQINITKYKLIFLK